MLGLKSIHVSNKQGPWCPQKPIFHPSDSDAGWILYHDGDRKVASHGMQLEAYGWFSVVLTSIIRLLQ